mmetsp:Transcript_19590/g.41179  ORF Transcript_19590/g.41179 Transcript_19590/m.41179 type:complete len:147 (+) Transcript_19590:1434-1874(+)
MRNDNEQGDRREKAGNGNRSKQLPSLHYDTPPAEVQMIRLRHILEPSFHFPQFFGGKPSADGLAVIVQIRRCHVGNTPAIKDGGGNHAHGARDATEDVSQQSRTGADVVHVRGGGGAGGGAGGVATKGGGSSARLVARGGSHFRDT